MALNNQYCAIRLLSFQCYICVDFCTYFYPSEHKAPDIRYLIHRLTTYSLHKEPKNLNCKQLHISYKTTVTQLSTTQNKTANEETQEHINKTANSNWALFMYSHTKFKTITKLLKQPNIAFKINNTAGSILNTKPKPNIHHKSGIYQLQWQTYHFKYTGKMGRTFYCTHTEHMQDIRNNRENTGFSYHILNNGQLW
jgi:hypothetical protein